VPERRGLVRHLIYPVPDPRLPFLGVHFTRRIDNRVEAGPNAVLALKREGYRRSDVSPRDVAEMLSSGGFWRMALAHWRTGLAELARSAVKRTFVHALQRLVPSLRGEDLIPGGSGVRAQAVDRSGALLDDFHIVEGERSIHLVNAPSPAATASITIGRHLARQVARRLGVEPLSPTTLQS
jgi:L-2-hydroxyglutarate oxidase